MVHAGKCSFSVRAWKAGRRPASAASVKSTVMVMSWRPGHSWAMSTQKFEEWLCLGDIARRKGDARKTQNIGPVNPSY